MLAIMIYVNITVNDFEKTYHEFMDLLTERYSQAYVYQQLIEKEPKNKDSQK